MQLSPAQKEEDVWFWLGQDAEHMLFFTLLIEDPAFKDEAKRLYAEYDAALRRDDVGAALAVLQRSQAFKLRLLAAAKERWIGSAYPLFIEHVHRELDFMDKRIKGQLSARDELCFGNRINAEHAAFAAHLLDPVEVAVQDQARAAAQKSAGLAQGCMTAMYPALLQMSRQAASELDQFVSGLNLAQTRSIIHPLLAAHVNREGKRFLGKIAELPAQEIA